MSWGMLSSIERVMLVALSDDGDDLAAIAKRADLIGRDVAKILAACDTALRYVSVDDPVRVDLDELRLAAELASERLAKFAEASCRPRLWLVP